MLDFFLQILQIVFLDTFDGSLKTRRNGWGFSNFVFGSVAWILANKAGCPRISKVYFWDRCLNPWKQGGMFEDFQIIFWNLCVDPWRHGGMLKDFVFFCFGGFDMAGPAKLLENTRKPHCDWDIQNRNPVAVGFSHISQSLAGPAISERPFLPASIQGSKQHFQNYDLQIHEHSALFSGIQTTLHSSTVSQNS